MIVNAAGAFGDYNFRSYFLRRACEEWEQYEGMTAEEKTGFEAKQKVHLELLTRQATISGMFPSPSYEGQNKL